MWQFWIDVGGTFTDCIAVSPAGDFRTSKVLSSGRIKGRLRAGQIAELQPIAAAAFVGWTVEATQANSDATIESVSIDDDGTPTFALSDDLPDGPVELSCGKIAPLVAIQLALGLSPLEAIPAVDLKLGTTRGTNALLERSGARVGFLTTEGFGDALRIGTQQRPELFDVDVVKPQPLYHAAAEVDERIDAAGNVVRKLERRRLDEALNQLESSGCDTVAIAFVNSYRNDVHEQAAAAEAHDRGFRVVTQSAALVQSIGFLQRAETAVLDAYLEPSLRDYIDSLEAALAGSRIRLMTSAGGLVSTREFRGTASLLSGPAGGVVGCADVVRSAGCFAGPQAMAGAIGFDMGGTSTDVCRVDRETGIDRVRDKMKAGVRVAVPTVAVETVAAGGGSICGFDGVKLTVGPESAGADPGPACYGRGGPLTVTDVNVLLGRVLPEHFPFLLDVEAAQQRLLELAGKLQAAGQRISTEQELLDGLFRIATENMARAIRRVTVANGHDPASDVLVVFGGAGGQYACVVAEELGCSQVLVHPYAGLLSAYGIGRADERAEVSEAVLVELNSLDFKSFEPIKRRAAKKLDGYNRVVREVDLRYVGTEATMSFPIAANDTAKTLEAKFHAAHHTRYGYRRERAVEVVNARVVLLKSGDGSNVAIDDSRWPEPPTGVATEPTVVADPFSTTVIDPGWRAERLSSGTLKLTHVESATQPTNRQTRVEVDPIQLELFNSRFAAIAEQMGVVLQNTSVSTNVKERLDFSCALFDAAGNLVVNAPHIPVHLGAMGETVRHLIRSHEIEPGDVFVTNDPYRGGSHLPDVTVVTPVFLNESAEPTLYVASRAHHAEIGGVVPGSIPPNSTTLAQEGVLIRDFRLVAAGVDRTSELEHILTRAAYPTRNVSDNLADISAQSAANQTGVHLLRSLVEREGVVAVTAYMTHIREAAARKTEAALREWNGHFTSTDTLDDGSTIQVTIDILDGRATFDFTGTDPVLSSNLNANRGIVTAAVLYTMRLMIGRVDSTAASMPLNDGVLEPVSIVLPECLLNPPAHDDPVDCAAIVGGNTETSQRVVDCLITALKLAACSQGTMNNVTFGDGSFGYYETIAGGSGASSTGDGADAVQVHMTNTRMTDVEVLEHRYPVRVVRFSLRRNSGGSGIRCGGDGVVRELEFLKPLSLSLLTGRRQSAPRGLNGGNDGMPGKNSLICAHGAVEPLEWRQQCDVFAGDILRLETPGGGGWGKRDAAEPSTENV